MRLITLCALILTACGPRVRAGSQWETAIHGTTVDPKRWYVTFDTQAFDKRTFFFDTGYSTTTCDDDFINELGIRKFGVVRIRGEAGTTTASWAKLPPFTMGSHQVRGVKCIVRDLNSTSSIKDDRTYKVAGVMGADIVRKFDLTVLPQRRKLIFHPKGSLNVRNTQDTVRIRWEHGLGPRFRLPLTINGTTRWPIVDTGASESHINGSSYDLPISRSIDNAALRGSGTNGVVHRTLDFIDVPKASFSGKPIRKLTFIDRPRAPWHAGLTGLNILNQFVQEYSFRSSRARVVPVKDYESESKSSTVR